MNLQQQDRFYEMMTRLRANSRAASTTATTPMVTEITNGLIVTRPAKKIEYLSDSEPAKVEQEAKAQVWNLTKDGPVPESKAAASVGSINKLREIIKFQMSNGRI